MVFHRFIAGGVPGRPEVVICVDEAKLKPWDPFAPDETERVVLPEQVFEVETERGSSEVRFRGVVLPPATGSPRSRSSSGCPGPRSGTGSRGCTSTAPDRLIQHGGWSGLRGIDEHTKLARAAVDFDTDLDEAFQINVAKMRVELPPVVKQMLERPVHELCVLADDAYRRSANATGEAGCRHPDGEGFGHGALETSASR